MSHSANVYESLRAFSACLVYMPEIEFRSIFNLAPCVVLVDGSE